MTQTLHLREQADRCRRLARDSTDADLRDSLLNLADEYASRADDQDNENMAALQARPDDDNTR